MPTDKERPIASARFETTKWSRVLRAGSADTIDARPALGELCAAYWFPLYAYARKRGIGPAEAEDAVQEFFARLLEQNTVRQAEPTRGRFRGFLVAGFAQHLARRHHHATAAKRRPPGGLIPLDTADGEVRYARALTDNVVPEQLFETEWAMAVLGRATERLQAEEGRSGRAERFEALRGLLTASDGSAREAGAALGMSEGAVRVALHRLRKRYGELLRDEVAGTLDRHEDVDDELRHLLAALGGRGGA